MAGVQNSPARTGRILLALCAGTTLSALNSGMVAVALVTFRREFGLDVAGVTWIVTVFYLTSAALQPLMGRLADRYGARHVFHVGMVVIVVAGALGPFAPSFAWLCADRVLLAIGTATAFPSAAAMLRAYASGLPKRASGEPVVRAATLIGRVQLIDTSSAAVGPALGGALILLFGWPAIFWINLPLAAAAFAGTALLLPADPPRDRKPVRRLVIDADVPGIALFVVAVAGLAAFVLEFTDDPLWWLLPVVLASGALFVWRELRCPDPFIDLRLLARNLALVRVYAYFALASLVFYSALFGLPQYLEDHGGYRAVIVGVLLLPLAAFAGFGAPLVERLIDRRGLRAALTAGAVGLLAAVALLPLLAMTTAPLGVLLVTVAVGVPYGVVLVSVTQSLTAASPTGHAGQAAGLFQTARSVGAICAVVIVGVAFADGTGPADWVELTAIVIPFALLYLAVVVFWRRPALDERD